MPTRKDQSKFAYMVHLLIFRAYELGYEITLGDALAKNLKPVIDFLNEIKPYLPPSYNEEYLNIKKLVMAALHKKYSKHYDKLAIDINLFKDGEYLTRTVDHETLGWYWESLGGTWGGRFNGGGEKGDGNHYSYKE